ncbi:MAG: S-layer homology domain-containing protein [Syntrophomonas sp.]|uniref:S-layer homology domain-containing protein n=1 Tax=Syntrophomonas sp. TaxID=2053627 RepID=UPI00263861DA|nr:S-layer homology domain-containing protein [Syntrophomonas sp.]MDD2510935.1 S-layer homology domain-containing protein [Syntrophomonas sp.]MDD3879687.1 S-layer homology domain-containing protein [Syntrophomonas sp.]MDD4626899.1 S-layer homology domain-containing protein [Syntrophomonas sp.]
MKPVATGSLTPAQQEAVQSGDLVLDINILSGTQKISRFNGTLSVQVPYNGPQPVAVWYLNDKGDLEKVNCTFKDGIVSVDLDHLSLYVMGRDTKQTDKEEPIIEDKEPGWKNPFSDVKEADWFYYAVNYVYKNGLMVGTSETTFSPYTNTTRGMIVTILHTLEGSPMPNITNGFTDVGSDKYYTDAVAWRVLIKS